MKKIIPFGSKATFYFPNKFECHYSAKDFFNDKILTSQGHQLELETIENLEGCNIVIENHDTSNYYDILFPSLFDCCGEEPLRFSGISKDLFKNISLSSNAFVPSTLEDEKANVLEDIFNEMTEKYIDDPNVLTSNLLDLIINKCQKLKRTDF